MLAKHDDKWIKAVGNLRQNGGINYLKDGEPSEYLIKSSLTIFTNSRLNFEPEKLHSEGKANKLYALPAQVGHKIKLKLRKLLQNWCYQHQSHKSNSLTKCIMSMEFSIPLKCKQDGSRLKSHNTLWIFFIGEKTVSSEQHKINQKKTLWMKSCMQAMSPKTREVKFLYTNSGIRKLNKFLYT